MRTETWYQVVYSNGDRNMLSPDYALQAYAAMTGTLNTRLYKQEVDLDTGKYIGPLTEVELDHTKLAEAKEAYDKRIAEILALRKRA